MSVEETIAIDRETLRYLKSLIVSAQVCLKAMDSRLQRELEVISVAKNLVDRSLEVLEDIESEAGDH